MPRGLKDLLEEARSRVREIEPDEAAALMEEREGLLVLDVREPPELAQGRLPGAHPVPRGVLEPKAASDSPVRDEAFADPRRPILVYCASGARSVLAADTLRTLGFEDVASLRGGFGAWKEAGKPVDTD